LFDGSSINCGMVRFCVRVFFGEWVDVYVFGVCFECVSVVGVLGLGGVIVFLPFKGSLSGWLFGEYVLCCLVPVIGGW
jgi:hypothetical protein